MRLSKWFSLLLCLLVVCGFFCVGHCHAQLREAREAVASLENEVENQHAKLQAVLIQLDKAQQRPEQLRYFKSIDEFKSWLAEDKTDDRRYSEDFNCLDFALMLQKNALEDGYIVSTESPPIANHWMNSVYINGSIYLVEPQRDEVVFVKGLR